MGDENDAPESWDLPDIQPKVQKLDKNGLPVLSMDDLSFVQESVEEDFDDGAVHGHNFLMQQKKAVEAKFRAEHPEEIDVADDDMLVNIAGKKGKFSDDADTPESWDLPDIKPKVQKLDKNGLPELSMDDLSFVQAQQVVQEPSLYQEQVKLFDHVQKFLASQKGPVIRKTGHTATKSELTQIASEVDGNLMKDCTGAEKEMCLFCQRAHRKIRRDPKYFVNGKRTGEELPDMPSECDKEELYLVAPPTIAMIQEHTMAPETEFMTFPSWVETEADF